MKQINRGVNTLSILYIILGVALIAFPGTSSTLVCQVLGGGVLAAAGPVRIFQYFTGKDSGRADSSDLAMGIVIALAGVLILMNTRRIISFMPFLFGAFMLAHSIITILNALEIRRAGSRMGTGALAAGIVGAVFAFIVLLNPFGTAMTLVRFMGIALVYNGVCNLGSYIGRPSRK